MFFERLSVHLVVLGADLWTGLAQKCFLLGKENPLHGVHRFFPTWDFESLQSVDVNCNLHEGNLVCNSPNIETVCLDCLELLFQKGPPQARGHSPVWLC